MCSVTGHLKGYPAGSAFHLVDFRDRQGVYCLYDDNFKIVYVGQAGANDSQRLFVRLRQHKSDALAISAPQRRHKVWQCARNEIRARQPARRTPENGP
jgi:hypothetical protein